MIFVLNNIFKYYFLFIGISILFINIYCFIFLANEYNIKNKTINLIKNNKIYFNKNIKKMDNEYYYYFKYINNLLNNEKIMIDSIIKYLNLIDNETLDNNKLKIICNDIEQILTNNYYVKSKYFYKKIITKIKNKYEIDENNCNKLIKYLILIK